MDSLGNQAILKLITENQARLEKNTEKVEETLIQTNKTLQELVTHMKLSSQYYEDFKEFKKAVKADIDFLKKPKDPLSCSLGVKNDERVRQNKEDIEEMKSQATWFNRLFVGGFVSGAIALLFIKG
jgi:hypothetical protein